MKSDCATARALFGINRQLGLAEERGDPYKLRTNSLAEFLVRNMKPLDYEAFGSFAKAGPRLVGEHTLKAVGLVQTHRGNIYYPLAIVEAKDDQDEEKMYGIGVGSEVLCKAADDLGLPPLDIKFHQLHEAVKQSTVQLPGWMHMRAGVSGCGPQSNLLLHDSW